MKEQEFKRLVVSVRQAGRIRRGRLKPGRVFHFRAGGGRYLYTGFQAGPRLKRTRPRT